MKSKLHQCRFKSQSHIKQRLGPKVLNYNALNHPEIIFLKPGITHKSALNTIESQVQPGELNLSGGLAAMLVNRIAVHKMREANHSGTNAANHVRNCKATAEAI
jgi:hypothetical protein